jgi:tRNA-Thr(GGU) m(6)t(6)A37 methyltransferase TsaA
MKEQLALYSVGRVSAQEGTFKLLIDEAYRPALTALEGFGFVNVLWWFDQLDSEVGRKTVICDKPYVKSPEKMGVFATRSPSRPNPIALTAVAVLHVDHERGIVTIPYIDADDGSPILDIKPYHPAIDRIRDVTVPSWCEHWPKWYEDSATFDWSKEFVNAT